MLRGAAFGPAGTDGDAARARSSANNKNASVRERYNTHVKFNPGYTGKDWNSELGIEEKLEKDIVTNTPAPSEDEFVAEATYKVEEVKVLAEQDLNMLAGLAIPAVFQFLYPITFLAVWQLLKDKVTDKKDPKIALGIPRGFAKTTLVKLFIIYCILFTKKQFILIICETATKAENIVADVVKMLQEVNILKLFGDWRLGAEMDRQDLKKFNFRGRAITLAAIGAGGSLRGLNVNNQRPDVMVFDDIQGAECAKSDVQSLALETWMVGTAMKAKSPHGCLFIFAGNMFPGPNSILKKLKKNPHWVKFISGAILADGRSLWEELRPLESLISEFEEDIAMGHPEIFLSEVMNDTETGINTSVDYSKLKPWPWQDYERPQGRFIVVDPSNDKKQSDLTAIGLCEVYDAVPALRDVIEERLSPGNTIRRALLLALRSNTKCIVVESTAYQASLLYWFEHISQELGITGFHFLEIHTGTNSKNYRIATALNELVAGEIILHPSVSSQVISQISNWSPLRKSNVDGILDLLSYMRKVLELYGHLIMVEDSPEVIEASGTKVVEGNWAF